MCPDVAVVGASAAGLFSARRLAAGGSRVTVFERATKLCPAPRSLIATSSLRDVLGPVVESSVVNEISGFELFADGMAAQVELSRRDLIVDRSMLIHALAADARDAGAEVRLASRIVEIDSCADELTIVTQGPPGREPWRCDQILGADGAFSSVARAGGWPTQTTVPLIQAVVLVPSGLPMDTVRVWFRPQDTPYFYWLIPHGDGTGVLGLIGDSRRDVRSRLEKFLVDQDLEPVSFQAARIPLYTRWRPLRKHLRGGAVYLVGDAAGHVKSTTVGGLVTGFRGANAVVDAMLGRSTRAARALRRELDRHLLVRRALHRFGEREYAKLISLIGRREHRLLASYSRDDTFRLLWRLCVREPRILALATRQIIESRSVDLVAD